MVVRKLVNLPPLKCTTPSRICIRQRLFSCCTSRLNLSDCRDTGTSFLNIPLLILLIVLGPFLHLRRGPIAIKSPIHWPLYLTSITRSFILRHYIKGRLFLNRFVLSNLLSTLPILESQTFLVLSYTPMKLPVSRSFPNL